MVYDGRFEILDYEISFGATHTMYFGNQTAGRVRAVLKNRLGFKSVEPSSVAMICSQRSPAFLLRYTGDFPFDELKNLRVTLTNDKDISKELAGGSMPDQTKQTFIGIYDLPWLPASEDSFRIELRLKSADDPIASWEVGRLYRHNEWYTPNP